MSVTLYFDGETRSQYTSPRAFKQTYTDPDGREQPKMVAELNIPEGVTDGAVKAGIEGLRRVLDEMGEKRAAMYAKVQLGWRPA